MEDINVEFLEAVKKGNISKVLGFIEKGADVNTTDLDGWAPLHWNSK